MPLQITNLSTDAVAINLAGVTPEMLAGRSLDEVRRMLVLRGNRQIEFGELFRLAGVTDDRRWELNGEFSNVHHLGAGMSDGQIMVDGPIGRHAGAGMRGGRLEVRGDAGDWLGAEMRGGLIRVRGDAGDYVGGAYRGSRRGMNGGTILLDGDAGSEVGMRMRRGMIAVAGSAGQWAAMRMLAGTVLVFGDCGDHPGLGMRRGTIGLFGAAGPTLLPTFRPGYRGPLAVLHLLEKQLHDEGFAAAGLSMLAGTIDMYHGDLLESGRGEILVPAS